MEKWVVKRYVYMLEPSDRVELNDDDVGSSDDRAFDCLADREFLAAALLCLKPREERLIRLRYGIGGIGEHTYREIGNELGTTVEHARQIHLKSLRKLRWHAKGSTLRGWPRRSRSIQYLPFRTVRPSSKLQRDVRELLAFLADSVLPNVPHPISKRDPRHSGAQALSPVNARSHPMYGPAAIRGFRNGCCSGLPAAT